MGTCYMLRAAELAKLLWNMSVGTADTGINSWDKQTRMRLRWAGLRICVGP